MQKSCSGRRRGHLISRHDANLAWPNERLASRGKRDRDDASHVTAQCKQAAANGCLRLERPDFPFAARRAAGARRLLSRAAWLEQLSASTTPPAAIRQSRWVSSAWRFAGATRPVTESAEPREDRARGPLATDGITSSCALPRSAVDGTGRKTDAAFTKDQTRDQSQRPCLSRGRCGSGTWGSSRRQARRVRECMRRCCIGARTPRDG